MFDIHKEIELLRVTRGNIIKLINEFSLDQLNKTPKGLRNNLIWNFGHAVITQQVLCYGVSGLKMYVDDDLVKSYKKGSKPGKKVKQEEFDVIMELAQSTIVDLEKDYNDELFQDFSFYTTSYGLTLTSIEDTIRFNNLHEAMHLGACKVISKLLF